MLRALGEVLGPDDRVLVIDDNSPDGTGELADRLAAELPFVDVLHRERKEGLGRAYIDGFRIALERGAELILELDCDFSHDPKDVPRLIAAAGSADLVLGSRYVPGGGVRDWGALRRLISRGGVPLHAASADAGPRRDRRLQVLPPRGARAARPRRDHLARLHVPDRDDVPRPPRRLPGRGDPDRLLRPRGRRLEDVAGQSSPRRSGRCRPFAWRRSEAGCEAGDRCELRGRRARGKRAGDRRLLGAVVQAVQGARADPGGDRGRARTRPGRTRTSTSTSACPPATASSRCRP